MFLANTAILFLHTVAALNSALICYVAREGEFRKNFIDPQLWLFSIYILRIIKYTTKHFTTSIVGSDV